MSDIVEELRSFSNWMVSCCLGSIPGEAKIMADAIDEITSLRSRLEQAERERDELNQECEASMREIAAGRDDIERLRLALQSIIDMNVQYAIDRYGDPQEAENMACVVTARAALAKFSDSPESPEDGGA